MTPKNKKRLQSLDGAFPFLLYSERVIAALMSIAYGSLTAETDAQTPACVPVYAGEVKTGLSIFHSKCRQPFWPLQTVRWHILCRFAWAPCDPCRSHPFALAQLLIASKPCRSPGQAAIPHRTAAPGSSSIH